MFRVVRLAALLVIAVILVLFPALSQTHTAFAAEGNYTFYLYSPSSQAKIVTCPSAFAAVYKFFHQADLTGESVVYKNADAQALQEKYLAKTLFSETVGDTVNYYCYSPALGAGVTLSVREVNLHLAVNTTNGRTAVGTPLIFGGF